MYRMSGEKTYLEYAYTRGDFVLKHIQEIKADDLLNGKAGVIILLFYLYEEGRKERYVAGAEKLVNLLENTALHMQDGMGWLSSGGQQPLAGLAHGCAGVALAIGRLWSYVKQNHYLDMLKAIIDYEDSLYDEQLENWLDLRKDKACSRDTVAWYHGAAGILLSRINIFLDTGLNFIRESQKSAFGKVASTIKKDMCYCHGNMGIKEILRYAYINMSDLFDDFRGTIDQISSIYHLSLEDRYNPGFMSGLAGIGYGLLREQFPDLPDVVLLKRSIKNTV